MLKAFKYRIYPAKVQAQVIDQIVSAELLNYSWGDMYVCI